VVVSETHVWSKHLIRKTADQNEIIGGIDGIDTYQARGGLPGNGSWVRTEQTGPVVYKRTASVRKVGREECPGQLLLTTPKPPCYSSYFTKKIEA
jgi:hypothetical protein